MRLRVALSIATLLFVTACVPYRNIERPLVIGAAISDPAREPISGAAVKLWLARQGKVFETHELTTDKKGRFQLIRQTTWSSSNDVDWSGFTVKVEIRAQGYATARKELRWLDSKPRTLDFGALRLSPGS